MVHHVTRIVGLPILDRAARRWVVRWAGSFQERKLLLSIGEILTRVSSRRYSSPIGIHIRLDRRWIILAFRRHQHREDSVTWVVTGWGISTVHHWICQEDKLARRAQKRTIRFELIVLFRHSFLPVYIQTFQRASRALVLTTHFFIMAKTYVSQPDQIRRMNRSIQLKAQYKSDQVPSTLTNKQAI